MAEEAPTLRTLVEAFTDFFTVAIHTILYERTLYPRTAFLTARQYNHPAHQSRHPKVCEWINDAVEKVQAELLKGTVADVAVVIFNKDNKPMERFVFDVSRFPSVPASDVDIPLERIDADGEEVDVLPTIDMEEQFRATMNKLTHCQSVLKPLPKGCTFTVAIELKPEGDAPVSHPQPWVPAHPGDRTKAHALKTTPVRKVQAGGLVFETWIEEGQDKP